MSKVGPIEAELTYVPTTSGHRLSLVFGIDSGGFVNFPVSKAVRILPGEKVGSGKEGLRYMGKM